MAATMAGVRRIKQRQQQQSHPLGFLSIFLIAAAALFIIPVNAGTTSSVPAADHQRLAQLRLQIRHDGELLPEWSATRRMLIGSIAPTCTYECKGCKYRCRAEQVPVDGNDPMNSAYRYKCVCHR
ncbi:hypothetical protein Ancab_033252 [Ancistrocladus abbreviatus]